MLRQLTDLTTNNIKDEIERLKQLPRLSLTLLLNSDSNAIFKHIANTLNTNNARQILYHAEFPEQKVPCCACGTLLKWNADIQSYRSFCSKACSARYTVKLKKEKNKKTIGVEWHSQLPDWKNKVQETSLKKFGVLHFSKHKQFAEQVKKSNLKKYNVEHVMHLEKTKSRQIKTNLERYGVENPSQHYEIKNKIKTTNLERYGVENPSQHYEIKNKIKTTNLERYGVENPASNPRIRSQITKSRRENYYSNEQLEKINDSIWLKQKHESGMPIWTIAKELNISSSNLCKIFHKLNIPIHHFSKSQLETQLYDYYTSQGVNVVCNSRKIIPPKEIDLFFPDYNLAIEINGSYFHSEKFNKFQNYHLDKTNQCLEKKIKLLQFWDFELNERWDQILNLIDSHLYLNKKVYARKTIVKTISSADKTRFINENHIQSDVSSDVNLGLFFNDELLSVATFGKNNKFSKKNKTFELLRLCSKSRVQIVGGASKLISFFVKNYMESTQNLISYCNRRYSIGNVYFKLGFTQIRISPPEYFYIDKSGKYAGTRYQLQKNLMKNKLINFNNMLTGGDNTKLNNYYKVWDCGQLVFKVTKE